MSDSFSFSSPHCGDNLPADPTPNPIICKLLATKSLVTEKFDQSKAIELIGFLGPLDSDGFVRLYVSLDLSASCRFHKDEIIYAEPQHKDPTRPTKVVLVGGANLEITVSVGESFVKGTIAENHKTATARKHAVPLIETFADIPDCAGGSGAGKGTGKDDDE